MNPNFKSKFEKTIFANLKKYGTVIYEGEKLKYVISRNYIPDFIVTVVRPDGTSHKIYIETKGYFSPQDRQKMKLVKEQNPELDIRFIFLQDNKLSKYSNTRYSDWAEKNGFPYTFHSPPKHWFK